MREVGIELFRVLISISLLAGVVYFQFMARHNLHYEIFHKVSYLLSAWGVVHVACLWLFEEGLPEAALHTVTFMSSGIACIWLRYNMKWMAVVFLLFAFGISVWGLMMRRYLEKKPPAQWAVVDVALGTFGGWILFLCAEIGSEVFDVGWLHVVASAVLSVVSVALPSPCMSVLGLFSMDVPIVILCAVSFVISLWRIRSFVV